MSADLAFGITAADRPHLQRLGSELERLGYAELWVNDTRRGDGLSTLAALAPVTEQLRLGVGVVALSDHAPAAIAQRVARAGLPADRLVVGVGSGSSASLALVRSGVSELRTLLPGIPIAVAAVGPHMLRLAGEIADAVVANWALPDRLAFAREQISVGAAAGGREAPRLVAYVRTTVGPGATKRLRAEMDRYRRYGGGHYARAFEAQPDALVGVAAESGSPAEMADALAPYRQVCDTLVVRAVPADDSVDGWLEVASIPSESQRHRP